MFEFVKRLFSKKKVSNLTDDARDKSIMSRKMNAIRNENLDTLRMEMEQLQFLKRERLLREQIENMRDELQEGMEESSSIEDQLFMQILNPVISKMATGIPQQQQIPSTQPIDMSEEEIRQLINQFGNKQVKMFSNLPDDQKRKLILMRFPNVSESSIETAIRILNNG
jgi:hypothetical protein